ATRGGLTAALEITGPAGSLYSGSTSVAQSSCGSPLSSGCTGTTMTPSLPTFVPGSPIVITGSGLTDFEGGPVQITALIDNYNVTAPTCVPRTIGQPPTCGGFDNITWDPTVTISYTYEDVIINDAPEPATLSILGLGGAALALLRRRRSRPGPPESR